MLYLPRTLALVVGLAGPAAGFGSFDGGTMIEVETETAGADYIRPKRLDCCPGGLYPPDDANGELPDGCDAFILPWRDYPNVAFVDGATTHPILADCVPTDLCKKIGDKSLPEDEVVTIQEGDDWCNAAMDKIAGGKDNEAKRAACSSGKILRRQKNVLTKVGEGVEYLFCSWDSTTNRCVLAGWSQNCANNEVQFGCDGVEALPGGRSGTTEAQKVVATKCSDKMEKSSSSFTSSGRPRYTRARSCQQKLLDCGTYDGKPISEDGEPIPSVKFKLGLEKLDENDGTTYPELDGATAWEFCNPTKGVEWDDCCLASPADRRHRELKEEAAPVNKKRQRRNLDEAEARTQCEAQGFTFEQMYKPKSSNDPTKTKNGFCCHNAGSTGVPIQVLGDADTYKADQVAPQTTMHETCEYTPDPPPSPENPLGKDTCFCQSFIGSQADPDNCVPGPPYPW